MLIPSSINKMKKGFTLIELLVVISIIGLLSSIVLASLSSARAKARDARRISDLHEIGTALELYFDKYGYYPQSSCGWDCNGYYNSDVPSQWSAFQSQIAEFMPNVPVDPINSASCIGQWDGPWNAGCYIYTYGNVGKTAYSAQYDLTASLETPNHPQSCGLRDYRYYFDNRHWCINFGGSLSNQIYEESN